MDTVVSDSNGCKNKELGSVESQKEELERDREEDSESNSLLPPRRGGMSKLSQKKLVRKVQWNDRNGNKLVEVLEFQPSDVSDTDEEDSDSCICTIM